MKYFGISLLVMLLIAACANVNRESREYYFEGKQIRHGIVPVATEESEAADSRRPIDAIAARRGKRVYQDNCLNCHGPQGRGNGPMADKVDAKPRDLVQVVETVPNFEFYIMASRYQGKMPGWQNVLTEEELSDLEHYIRSLAE